MITLKIDNDEQTMSDQAQYLNDVAEKIEDGFTSGPGWEITGTDEDEDDDDL